MTKQEFLAQLCNGLSGLPHNDIEERLSFFDEMIEDRMEEGLSEEEAVAAAGSVEEIISQAVAETPLAKIAKERITPKRKLKTWEIVLLIAGSPIWFALAIALASIVFSVYVSLWAVIIALWAAFASMVFSTLVCFAAGVIIACIGKIIPALAMISAGLVLAGLSIFMCIGCIAITKCIVKLTEKFALWIKGCFIKKEEL